MDLGSKAVTILEQYYPCLATRKNFAENICIPLINVMKL